MTVRELLKFPGVAPCVYIYCHLSLMSTVYTSGSSHSLQIPHSLSIHPTNLPTQ